jgi:hypothetical protein
MSHRHTNIVGQLLLAGAALLSFSLLPCKWLFFSISFGPGKERGRAKSKSTSHHPFRLLPWCVIVCPLTGRAAQPSYGFRYETAGNPECRARAGGHTASHHPPETLVLHSGKMAFPECLSLFGTRESLSSPSATLDFWHSGNFTSPVVTTPDLFRSHTAPDTASTYSKMNWPLWAGGLPAFARLARPLWLRALSIGTRRVATHVCIGLAGLVVACPVARSRAPDPLAKHGHGRRANDPVFRIQHVQDGAWSVTSLHL